MVEWLTLLAQQQVQNYLVELAGVDEKEFVLKQKDTFGIPAAVIATQLAARKKAAVKIPSWHATRGIVYPPTVNLEQSSSEATARYKASLMNSLLGPSARQLAGDLTGGFGVDGFYMAKLFASFHLVEKERGLLELAQHNHHVLGASGIVYYHKTAEDFIEKALPGYDLIFIDPSRRSENTRKVFRLADCTPDVTLLQDLLFQRTTHLLIKASPLLDLQQGLREIKHVKSVTVLSVENEVKEVLFFAEKSFSGEPSINAVDLSRNGDVQTHFSFTAEEEKQAQSKLEEPQRYLYEPNASILKAGAFKLIGEKYDLTKLAVNTHLYTSTEFISGFPGRTFRVDVLNPDAKQVKEFLPHGQANVATRNYPLTPDQIKKKLGLRDGGEKFVLAFSSSKKKFIAACTRI